MQCVGAVQTRPVAIRAARMQSQLLTRPATVYGRYFVPIGAQSSRQQLEMQADDNFKLLLPLQLAVLAGNPLAAWADDAAQVVSNSAADVQSAVTTAVTESNKVEAPAWLGYALLLSPIILYVIFNVYRSQVNPRVKFTDFLFICAGVAVIANLVSILAFRVRLF